MTCVFQGVRHFEDPFHDRSVGGCTRVAASPCWRFFGEFTPNWSPPLQPQQIRCKMGLFRMQTPPSLRTSRRNVLTMSQERVLWELMGQQQQHFDGTVGKEEAEQSASSPPYACECHEVRSVLHMRLDPDTLVCSRTRLGLNLARCSQHWRSCWAILDTLVLRSDSFF